MVGFFADYDQSMQEDRPDELIHRASIAGTPVRCHRKFLVPVVRVFLEPQSTSVVVLDLFGTEPLPTFPVSASM
jgi:hypothetical protein